MTRLAVASAGIVTPLGASARETIAALERGERRFERAGIVGVRGAAVVGSFALPVRDDLAGPMRAELLAVPALAQAIHTAAPMRGDAALFLCAPAPWGGFAADLWPLVPRVHEEWTPLVEALAGEIEACGGRVPDDLRFVIARGHASGVLALERAAVLLQERDVAQAFIVGVDAHGDRATLERLDMLGALRSWGNPGGFFPGEAAAALCVRRAGDNAGRATVSGLGVAEDATDAGTARGLTDATTRALATWGGDVRTLGAVAHDLNGERGRAVEWSLTATRTVWRERATPAMVRPAEHLGDVGAATVPLLVGICAADRWKSAPVLVLASSRDGLRGGAVIDGFG